MLVWGRKGIAVVLCEGKGLGRGGWACHTKESKQASKKERIKESKNSSGMYIISRVGRVTRSPFCIFAWWHSGIPEFL